jgi:hypothetical protein
MLCNLNGPAHGCFWNGDDEGCNSWSNIDKCSDIKNNLYSQCNSAELSFNYLIKLSIIFFFF